MKRKPAGFTLVELLVVIAIIGILMGLAIPAVNSARETARQTECSNNIRNIAMGAIMHENKRKRLPGYTQKFGVFGDDQPGGLDDPSEPGVQAIDDHVKIGTWAVALLSELGEQPTYEHWTEDRYPLIDLAGGDYEPTNEPRFEGVGFHPLAAPNLAVFQCPSSPSGGANYGRNNYVSNNGESSWYLDRSGNVQPNRLAANTADAVTAFQKSMSRANGAFNNQYQGTSKTYNYVGDKVRLDDFKDGQGNTILYSENVQALPWHRAGYLDTTDMSAGIDLKSKPRVEDIPNTPEVNPDNLSGTELALAAARYTNGMVWHYEDPDYQNMNNHVVTHVACRDVDPLHKINGRGTETGEDIFTLEMEEEERTFIDLARPSSAHSGGVNVALADGSVKFITDSIDYRVYQALLTPRGKSSNVPWPEFVMTDEIE